MKVTVNNIAVDIDDVLINEYVAYGNDFDDLEVRYLLDTSGIPVTATKQSIKNAIEKSLKECLEVERKMPVLLEEMDGQMNATVIHS